MGTSVIHSFTEILSPFGPSESSQRSTIGKSATARIIPEASLQVIRVTAFKDMSSTFYMPGISYCMTRRGPHFYTSQHPSVTTKNYARLLPRCPCPVTPSTAFIGFVGSRPLQAMSVEAIEGCLASPKTALRGEYREVMVKAPLPLLFPGSRRDYCS